MKRIGKLSTYVAVLFISRASIAEAQINSQQDYSDARQLAKRVEQLSSKYPKFLKSQSIAKTLGGKEIWMLTIGTDATDTKPALAIVGGVDGTHLLGVELAIGFAENLMQRSSDPEIQHLLERQTLYVFPNMSPDATEQYFAPLQYARRGNARLVDYDRDGEIGEDGYDDLDRDGKITFLRIEDQAGTHILNPNDSRSVIRADKSKGEVGKYLLLSEGIDNDGDGALNEDGDEGIHFNKNATYNYKNFQPGAGEHAVSEIENRALFDLLYDKFSIYAVLSFGPDNTLMHAPSPSSNTNSTGRNAQVSGWSAEDAHVAQLVSEKYKQILSTKDAPRTRAEDGDFNSWAYYHYGRLSFSTPGWWVPKTANSTAERNKESGDQSSSRNNPANGSDDPVLNYLRWAASTGIDPQFTPWTAIEHPDFPGKRVEVGGIHPYALQNPPYELVPELVTKHTDFIVEMSKLAPFIRLDDVNVEQVGEGVSRVSLRIVNTGHFPTISHPGTRNYFLKLLNVQVKTQNNQQIISGKAKQTLNSIPGNGFEELSWLIRGAGVIEIEASSPQSGTKTVNLTL